MFFNWFNTPKIILFTAFIFLSKTITSQEHSSRRRTCKCLWVTEWLRSGIASFGVNNSEDKKQSPRKAEQTSEHKEIISAEQAFTNAVVNGNHDDIQQALARNPDPFESCYIGGSENITLEEFSTKYRLGAWINCEENIRLGYNRMWISGPHMVTYILPLLRSYSDEHLLKVLEGHKRSTSIHPEETKNSILLHTPLPTIFAALIIDYIGRSIQLKPTIMRYIAKKIEKKVSEQEKNALSILPYCTDEKGNNIFHYTPNNTSSLVVLVDYGVDPIVDNNGQQMFYGCDDQTVRLQAIKNHVKNIQKNPVLLYSSKRDNRFFFEIIRHATFWDYRTPKHETKFEQSPEYACIEEYLKLGPHILNIHTPPPTNRSVFDIADTACPGDQFYVGTIGTLLKLLLDHKADPNMQNSDGNTFLHRIVSDVDNFNSSYNRSCPDNSPFIEQCRARLNLAIANKSGKTVFDILEAQIKQCEQKKDFKTRDTYRQFAQKLISIQASQAKSGQHALFVRFVAV